MPRVFPAGAFTPGQRMGVGPVSRELLDTNESRNFILIYVEDEAAKVTLSLSESATVGEGPAIQNSDGLIMLRHYEGPLSAVTSTEGANEKQKLTVDATGGTFTLTFEGDTTGDISEAATALKIEEELAALETLDAADVKVEGAAGGPWTIEFEGAKKAMDVELLQADGAKLTGGGKTATVTTETPGGVPVQIAEG